MPTLVTLPERPLKLRPPVIPLVVASTTTAPRPVPDATGYMPDPDPPPYPPPPPQETTIPARTADTIRPIKPFRMFIMSISLRRVCDAECGRVSRGCFAGRPARRGQSRGYDSPPQLNSGRA